MRLRELYRSAYARLAQCEQEPIADMYARQLICYACEKSFAQYLAERDREATNEQCFAVEQALQRLIAGEPLAYILGEWSFYGLDLYVDENVLIPRDDSCALAQLAIVEAALPPNARILDLCTGSGCIGLAVAADRKDTRVVLADISEPALAVARKNVERLNLASRVQCVCCDALDMPPSELGKFHMIVSNPPYVTTAQMQTLERSVVDHEPQLALHGGVDGLQFYRAIVKNFRSALHVGGYLAFEHGEGQGDAVCALLKEGGFTVLRRAEDFQGRQRACLARYDRKEE